MKKAPRFIVHFLVERHLAVASLASLKLLVQERAGLLISLVNLQAFVEHLLVLSAGTHELRLLRLLWLNELGLFRSSLAAATSKGSSDGTHSAVGNGTTGTKSHSLSDGRTNSREHAAAGRLLHRSGRSRLPHGSRSSRSRSTTSSRLGRGTTGSTQSTTTTRALRRRKRERDRVSKIQSRMFSTEDSSEEGTASDLLPTVVACFQHMMPQDKATPRHSPQ